MAGQKPEDFTVQAIQEDGGVVFQNVATPVAVLPKGTPVRIGQVLKGWLNLQGQYGPYFKVASERPQSASNGSRRDEATGQSIEAQVSAYCASYVIAAGKVNADGQNVKALTAAFFDAIQEVKSRPAVGDAPDLS